MVSPRDLEEELLAEDAVEAAAEGDVAVEVEMEMVPLAGAETPLPREMRQSPVLRRRPSRQPSQTRLRLLKAQVPREVDEIDAADGLAVLVGQNPNYEARFRWDPNGGLVVA
ncbi:hypothetical protein G7Z17_g5621 [Cylindrodendrum hubeiense]|uniref:Uncharacterized protein n=1 Tax=Cylindrodendrum hubeiense TaxID=595255 RepID=A0A9P5HEK9_9HYPO|nr:hypothetical protein G7Z17_g5621 [Cylindrodendrum hubeiense]